MGALLTDQLKMKFSVLSLPVFSIAFILLLQVHQEAATVALTVGTLALAVLTKLSGVVGGGLLSRALSSRGGRRSSRRYGKRSAQAEDLELDVALNMLSEVEPEHCYKRIICAAGTGKYYNQKLEGIMSLVTEKGAELRAGKFVSAAQYGQQHGDVAKCEHRYQCSMDLEIIKSFF